MCDKAVNRCFFVFDSIPDRYKTQEMCARVVSEDFCLMVYCHEKYKTQRICDEAVDDYLAALKYIPDWFVTSKILRNFLLLCTQMIIDSILIKILIISCFLVMK